MFAGDSPLQVKLLDISEGDECLLLDIMENENDVFLIKLTKLDSF